MREPVIANRSLLQCAMVEIAVVHAVLCILAHGANSALRERLDESADLLLRLAKAARQPEASTTAEDDEIVQRINQRFAELCECAAAKSVTKEVKT